MEMSKGYSLHRYLKQTKLSFFLNKIREQEGITDPALERGLVLVRGGRR
jgi:hypothetical protein